MGPGLEVGSGPLGEAGHWRLDGGGDADETDEAVVSGTGDPEAAAGVDGGAVGLVEDCVKAQAGGGGEDGAGGGGGRVCHDSDIVGAEVGDEEASGSVGCEGVGGVEARVGDSSGGCAEALNLGEGVVG